MTKIEVVSNTSPMITLVETLPNGADFLRASFSKVIIPRTVIDELIIPSTSKSVKNRPVFKSPEEYLEYYGATGIIEIKEIEIDDSIPDIDTIDAGEAAAITLAIQEDKLLLIDEKKGRKVARNAGLLIRRSPKQLVLSAEDGYITTAEAKKQLDFLFEVNRIGAKAHQVYWKQLE